MSGKLMQIATVTVSVGLLLLIAAPGQPHANTVAGPREKIISSYTTRTPHSATGLTYDIAIHNPSDPPAAPIPVRKMVVTAPRGVRLDQQLIPRCTASDAQFELEGASACPAASKVADGTTVTRPLGGMAFTSQVAAFKTPDGMALLIKFATAVQQWSAR